MHNPYLNLQSNTQKQLNMLKSCLTYTLCCLLSFAAGSDLMAQKRGGGKPVRKAVVVKKTPHGKTKVVKVKHGHYSRKKVVVVKQRRVRTITVLPNGYSTHLWRGKAYHYHAGYYYLPQNGAYVLVLPPRGMRMQMLPPAHRVILVGSVSYYYFGGIWYRQVNSEYEIVDPPIGAIVSELPEDNVEEITIDGNTYYEHNGYLYKPTGSGTYEVVGKLED